MFDSTILDVAIGLVFVYLVLSLIGTATNEFLASLMKRRAKDLEKGLVELLQDDSGVNGKGVVAALYDHPLIDSLYRGDIGGTGARKADLPSYIPSRSFALALLDLVQGRDKGTPSAASGTTPSASTTGAGAAASAGQVQALRVALDSSPLFAAYPDLRQAIHALVDAAGDDMGQVRTNVEGWFNAAMDRVSGWYKRRTQYLVLGIGLFLAAIANADTFAIGDALARQKAPARGPRLGRGRVLEARRRAGHDRRRVARGAGRRGPPAWDADRLEAVGLRHRLLAVGPPAARLVGHRLRDLAGCAVLVRRAQQDHGHPLDGEAAREEPGAAVAGLKAAGDQRRGITLAASQSVIASR